MGQHTIPGPKQDRLTKAEVILYLGISESGFDKMVRDRRFPKGVKPTSQSSPIWSGALVAAWLFVRHAMGGDEEEKEEKS